MNSGLEVCNGRDGFEQYASEYTATHYDWPERTGVIVGRLDLDDGRFLAMTTDAVLLALMTDGDPLGARIHLAAFAGGINRETPA